MLALSKEEWRGRGRPAPTLAPCYNSGGLFRSIHTRAPCVRFLSFRTVLLYADLSTALPALLMFNLP